MGLISLDLLKAKLGITDESQDEYLQLIIDGVSLAVKNITNRNLELTAYEEEKHVGTGTTSLLLNNYPIASVQSLKINNEETSEYDILNDKKDAGKLFKKETWPRNAIIEPLTLAKNGSVLRENKNISIDYTAGYDPIPADVQLRVLEECTRSYEGKNSIGNIKSWELGNASEDYTEGNGVGATTGFTSDNEEYFKKYYGDYIIND